MFINKIDSISREYTRRDFFRITAISSSVILASQNTVKAEETKQAPPATPEQKEQNKILEYLNPNLTEAIPVVICNFYESSKLIENNFETKVGEFEIRNSNADTYARAISGSLSYLALLGSRVSIESGSEAIKKHLSEDTKKAFKVSDKNISNFSTISAFHFQTLILVYGTVPLIKIFREAYLETLKNEKYKNDPRKVSLSEIVKAIIKNKEKIALDISDDINHIKQIPKDYVQGGLGTSRGYIDHLTIALSYIIGMQNTGLGRFSACVSRSGLISRNLIALENEEELPYKNQVVRCAAESITWPSMYASNGIAQSALNYSNAIPNPENNLGTSNLKELIGNLVFTAIFIMVKTPAQKGLENYFHNKFDEPTHANPFDKALKDYIHPRRFRA